MLSLICCTLLMASVCARSVVRVAFSPSFLAGISYPLVWASECGICGTDLICSFFFFFFQELVHGAFKEAGFVTDKRPLKVRPKSLGYISSSPRHHLTKQHFFLCFPLLLPFFPSTYSCIAHFSTRHTVVPRRPVSAAALVPQGAYRSPSLRFRRPQMAPRMTLVYGPWMSCRFARWEAGHRTGRMCESRVVIFDQAGDVTCPREKIQDPFAYS